MNRKAFQNLVLDNLARVVLKSVDWIKRKRTIEKVEPTAHFFAEEQFTFQRVTSTMVYNHDIPADLVINLDQTPLSYVSPGKCRFNFKGAKNVYIKGVYDKRQITLHLQSMQPVNFYQCN